MNPFPVLHLVEDLRLALEMLEHPQERAALLSQIPGPTAAYIKEWFKESSVSRPVAWVGERSHGARGMPSGLSGVSELLLFRSLSIVTSACLPLNTDEFFIMLMICVVQYFCYMRCQPRVL